MISKLIWFGALALALAACGELSEHGGMQGITALEAEAVVLV